MVDEPEKNLTEEQMDTAALLRAAKAKIDKPEAWIKARMSMYRRSDGSLRYVNEFCAANCFCALGAISEVSAGVDDPIWQAAITHLNSAVKARPEPYEKIIGFNDAPETNHAMIMNVFDAAIKMAEAA